jgi:hypothetical protein
VRSDWITGVVHKTAVRVQSPTARAERRALPEERGRPRPLDHGLPVSTRKTQHERKLIFQAPMLENMLLG